MTSSLHFPRQDQELLNQDVPNNCPVGST